MKKWRLHYRVSNIMDRQGEKISKLDDCGNEIIYIDEQKENKEENEHNLRDPWDTISSIQTYY